MKKEIKVKESQFERKAAKLVACMIELIKNRYS